MPHFKLEYSTNISEKPVASELFSKLHHLLCEIGPFEISSIKSRIYPCENFFVSTGDRGQAFIHLELSILSGRSEETKKKVGEQLLGFLREEFIQTAEGKNCSITVDIRELNAAVYAKLPCGEL